MTFVSSAKNNARTLVPTELMLRSTATTKQFLV